jgi:hypothetical protein
MFLDMCSQAFQDRVTEPRKSVGNIKASRCRRTQDPSDHFPEHNFVRHLLSISRKPGCVQICVMLACLCCVVECETG